MTTTTPTVTIADLHKYAGDLVARTDLTIDDLDLSVYGRRISVQTPNASSLRVAYDLLDNPTVRVADFDDGTYQRTHVNVEGTYRGVHAHFYAGFYQPADRDLIRSFAADNHLNDARLLDVLVGDVAVRDERP
jgi:hypothetical protein